MALFGKGKGKHETTETETEGTPPAPAELAFSPEKAEKFFDFARTRYETGNYGYAMQLWLNGLSQDPGNMDALRGFLDAAGAQQAEGKKGKGEIKDVAKGLNGKGALLKYQSALLDWSQAIADPGKALKATEVAGSLGVTDVAKYIGRVALNAAKAEKKQSKDRYVKLFEIFAKSGVYDLASEAGDIARRMDPGDGDLDRRVKSMMAQAAISTGGFDDNGGPGGFRRNIRDAEKQTQLEAADRISKTEDVKDRLLAEAEAEYEDRPGDAPTITKLGRALMDRGKSDDVKRAIMVYNKAHKELGEFRFRQASGDAMIVLMRRKLRALRAKLEKAPESDELKAELAATENSLLETEIKELRLRVENYPTDLGLKFELGKRMFLSKEWEAAIEQFQLAQEDAKNRRAVLNMMAQCFLRLGGWEDAAVSTFRQALEGIVDTGSELSLELNYGLMCALLDKASVSRDLAAAEEADRLASQIAMKKFNYRDVKDRREQIKTLLADIRG